jgi:hypothetical protein
VVPELDEQGDEQGDVRPPAVMRSLARSLSGLGWTLVKVKVSD